MLLKIVVLLQFLHVTCLLAQTPVYFDQILPDEGLSQSTVNCLIQDRYGFMWIGTQDGLNCYDGYRFVIYRNRIGDSASIIDNSINALHEDSEGRLWIGTSAGVSEYRRETNTFINYPSRPGDTKTLIDPEVHGLAGDDSILWIATENGLNRMNKITREFQVLNRSSGISDVYLTGVKVDKKGWVWLPTISGGLDKLDPTTGKITNFRFDRPGEPTQERVFKVFEEGDDVLWIATSNGIHRLNTATGQMTGLLEKRRVYDIYRDSRGVYWAGAREGLFRFQNESSIDHFVHSSDDRYGLSNTVVNCIYEDRSGVMWFGTQYGLTVHDPMKSRFGHIAPSSSGLPVKDAWWLHEDREGYVWIGSYNQGLVRLDPKKQKFEHWVSHSQRYGTLTSNLVRSVVQDTLGQLWIGMWGGGLNTMNPKTFAINVRPIPEWTFRNVMALLSDGGRLWIGTDGGGLFNYEFVQRKLTAIGTDRLSDPGITTIFKDAKGKLWVGTRRGLNCLSPKTDSITVFRANTGHPGALTNDYVMCVAEDRFGQIWIGTDKGLNRFNPDRGTMDAYYEQDGLPNATIYGIIEDHRGQLWMTTNKGLVRTQNAEAGVHPVFRVFDKTDGLQSNEFNQSSYIRLRDNKIIVGGVNGINIFHPDSIGDNRLWPPIRFTDFKILNESIGVGQHIDRSITTADHVVLYPEDNVFSIEFAALDLINSARIIYAYRLRGFQKEWTFVDADHRQVTYTNLDPGSYVFEVKYTNRDAVWSPQPLALSIQIIPPFWKTWWFRVVLAASMVLLVFTGHRYRLIQIRRRNETLERLVIQRTQEITESAKELQQAIDDLKRAQAQLVQSEKMAALGQMVAGVAHEINNPLTFIEPNLQYIQTELRKLKETDFQDTTKLLRSAEETSLAIKSALTGCHRIKTIVENLKTFAQPGQEGLAKSEINGMLNVLIDLFNYQYPGILVEKQFGRPAMIQCYVSDLNLALMDILDNAAIALQDAVQQGLRKGNEIQITVATELSEAHVTISIDDNGVGIPVAVQQRIFEPFFTTRSVGAGRGLGLAEVYGIVKKHRGEIRFTSEVAKGSRFSIQLPLLQNNQTQGMS